MSSDGKPAEPTFLQFLKEMTKVALLLSLPFCLWALFLALDWYSRMECQR
jgi:hypothetical protein